MYCIAYIQVLLFLLCCIGNNYTKQAEEKKLIRGLTATIEDEKYIFVTWDLTNVQLPNARCLVSIREKCSMETNYLKVSSEIVKGSLNSRNTYIYNCTLYNSMCIYEVQLDLLNGTARLNTAQTYTPKPLIKEIQLYQDSDGNGKIKIKKMHNIRANFSYRFLLIRCNATTNCTVEDVIKYNTQNSPNILGVDLNETYLGSNLQTSYNYSLTCLDDCNIFVIVCLQVAKICSKKKVKQRMSMEALAIPFYYYILIPPILIVILGIVFCILYRKCIKDIEHIEQYYLSTPLKIIEENTEIEKTTFNKTSLDEFLREESSAGIIEEEHENIPQHLEEFVKEYDKKKNRYKDVLPFASNRVKLDNDSYINASYIKNYKNENAYIATQGPLNDSQTDFWGMIWEQNVTTIVMLTNLIENQTKKCTKYWPEKMTTKSYGKIKVYVIKVKSYAHYIVREFKVSYKDEVKHVRQFHYTCWPDHNLPISPTNFIKFIRMVRDVHSKPVVVHCSAGIGRTGSFILINLVYEMAIETDSFDFASTLQKMRCCRAYMLRDHIQYKLCYCVVNELLNGEVMEISTESLFKDTLNEIYLFKSTLEYINDNDYWLDIFKRCIHPIFYENTKKNRIQKPYKSCFGHFYLRRSADVDNSDYINAVQIGENVFSAQQPMPSTIGDFWRLVLQKKIGLIASLNAIDVEDKTSIVFWPMSILAPMCPEDYIEITLLSILTHDGFDVVELKLTNIYDMVSRNVRLMNFKSWKKTELPNTSDFLQFYQSFLDNTKKDNFVVACSDGSRSVGMFLAFYYTAQHLDLENTIDISSVVRTLRFYRDDYVNDLDQLRFIFIMVQKLLLEKETYRQKINEQLGLYSNMGDNTIYENV